MSDLKKLVETIEKFIPGIKEYKEKEELREEDLKVRQLVRDALQGSLESLRDVEQFLVGVNPNFDPTLFEEQVIQRLEVLLRRVESAEAGYGGWLSHVNIEQAQLAVVLENDQNLLNAVSNFTRKVIELENAVKSSGDLPNVLEITKALGEIERLLARREEILRSGGGVE